MTASVRCSAWLPRDEQIALDAGTRYSAGRRKIAGPKNRNSWMVLRCPSERLTTRAAAAPTETSRTGFLSSNGWSH
jgi:hypothetical protein